MDSNKIAIVQHTPCLLDREATLKRAVERISTAAREGATLIVFPEAFVPGYPSWIWRLRPGTDWDLNEALHLRLLENSVALENDDLKTVRMAARESGVTVVMGVNERDGSSSRSTLYNTVVVIDHEGLIINQHRKLMPTNPERMTWGSGDASGLKVLDTPCGRLGTLLCWENYMPLARYALYAQGVEVYIAPTYDSGEGWIGTLQHIAREGGCWVLGAGVALHNRDIPEHFPHKKTLFPDTEDWINPGDSVVIAPGGELTEGPVHEEQKLLYAQIDLQKISAARRTLDVAGHYARPDIFRLRVNAQPQTSLAVDDIFGKSG